MLLFETILGLLLAATILSMLARRARIPYPTLLALGGAVIAFLPGLPRLDLPPDLILALFVAPVLLDAAYDASLRDLRRNWRPILSLVLVAVGLTTLAVALAVRHLVPDMPWAAAIALGALLAPPDAVAALAVMRHVTPPHRIRMILEGESLLNDASALLLYKLAVGAVAVGGFSAASALPTFTLVVFGSIAAGWALAWPVAWANERISDVPSAVILQFVGTFGVWLLAEQLGLSGVVTIVVFGLTLARSSTLGLSARLRIPSFAIWESATFVLNVLAFTLIGLQMGPVLDTLDRMQRLDLGLAAVVILAVVVAIRLVWVMAYSLWGWRRAPGEEHAPLSLLMRAKGGLVIGWSGMRGIVTLAAAMALPAEFPHRDFIQLTAFVVVLGTLLLQGLTLRPLLALLRLPKDDTVAMEIGLARGVAFKAAMAALERDDTEAAQRLRMEYQEALSQARSGHDPRNSTDNMLRRQVVPASRRAIAELRRSGRIGDDAYRAVEEELDWLELSARSRDIPG